ncbi:MAG: hypothetical protein QXW09_02020 [Thermoproteota archaeon]
MRLRRRAVGLSLILLMLTYDFHVAILALANGQTSGYVVAEGTSSNDFFRKQLEEGIPPDEPLLERRYIIPSGMNVKHADEIWLTVASLISLGYDEEELAKTLSESVLPRKLEANNIAALIDYANLRITRNLEDGGVSVEIPVLCNSSLPSTYYEVRGAKKRIKLCNVTSIKYYNVSLNARELYNVTYSSGETGRASEAAIDFSGGIKNHLVNAYLPNPEDPVPTEVRIGLLSHGVTLSLRVLEHRVHKIIFNGREVDCYWVHVNRTLKAARDVRSVMLSIGYDGVWITRSWLILRKGEYVSDHWIKWTPSDRLTIDLCIEGFRSTFMLNFHENASIGQGVIKEVLSEDCLKELLEQPFYEKLNLSRAPKSWSIKLAGEKVTNETLWATGKEYEWLMRVGCRKGNSLFIDSGEAEWEYAVTNRTLGSCNSIKLFYNPLKVNKGELVHGLTLRNYASENVSYTLRLRTISNYFFFFSSVQEGSGSIVVNKSSTSQLLLVQQEPAVGDAVLELVKDGRVVAAVKVSLAIKATMFWKGFWDGLASKLPGIMITAGVMMAMGFLIPHAYVRPAYYLLLGIGVLSNLMEIALDAAEAYRARDEMLLLADAVESRSIELLAKGSVEHAAECKSFALALRKEANETMSSLIPNVLLDLTIGVSLDEIRVAIGLKEPLARDELERQYKIGYARGKVTGAVISCVLYVTLFVMINRVKAERIGQHLTTSQILRTMAKGFYNWITPSIWDATILVIEKKGGKFLSRVIDLFLGNSYSTRLGEAVGSLVDGIRAKLGDDCPEVGEALEYSSSICKQVIENVPSRESSSKILDALGMILEHYSLDEMNEKGGTIVGSIISIWVKDGDEAVNRLNEWLKANPMNIKAFADEILLTIKGDVAKDVGLRIGIVANSYFDLKDNYGISVAEAFVKSILGKPELIEIWEWAIKNGGISVAESGVELKLTDIDGERYTLIVNNDGSLCLRHASIYNEYFVKAIYDETIKDKSGRTIIIVKCIEHTEGTARLVLERNIPNSPILFISNEAIINGEASKIIKVKQEQTSFEIRKILQLILGAERYGVLKVNMENKMAVVGLAYRKGDKIDVMWTGRTFLELEAVSGVDEILGIAIVRAEDMSFTGGATTLRLSVVDGKELLTIVSEGGEKRFGVEAEFKRPQYGGVTLGIQFNSGRRIGFRVGLSNNGEAIEILPAVGRGDKYDILPKDTHIEFFEEYPILGEDKVKNILVLWCKEGNELNIHALSLTDSYITAKDLRDVKHTVAKYSCIRSFKNIGIKVTGAEFIVDLNENEKIKTGRKKVIFDFIGEMDDGEVTKTVAIEVKHGYEEEPDLTRDADSYVLIAQDRRWVMVYYFFDEPQTGATKNLLNHLIELTRKYPGGLRIYIEGKGWILR